MAGMVYTSIDAEKLTTAEFYGIALRDLASEHDDVALFDCKDSVLGVPFAGVGWNFEKKLISLLKCWMAK